MTPTPAAPLLGYLMYAMRRWVGAPWPAGLNAFLPRLRSHDLRVASSCGIGSATRGLERPVAATERAIKGLLFDLPDCAAQCVLSSTGMSCPHELPEESPQRPRVGGRTQPNGCCESTSPT